MYRVLNGLQDFTTGIAGTNFGKTMTKERAKELLPIIKAFSEGMEIQSSPENEENWETVYNPLWVELRKYRIKPESKYRPFNNAKEFIEALNKHGGWMRVKNANFYFIPLEVGFDSITSYTSTVHSYCDVLDRFVFYDGTPCGVEK